MSKKKDLKEYCMNNRDYGFKEDKFDELLSGVLLETKEEVFDDLDRINEHDLNWYNRYKFIKEHHLQKHQ